MVIVTGQPGNRGDFVAGWLARTDPQRFGNLPWFIWPQWGKSTIQPIWNWHKLSLDWVQPNRIDKHVAAAHEYFRNILPQQLDDHAPMAVTKSHTTSRYLSRLIPPEYQDRFIFIDILVNDMTSYQQVRWEEFVKNVLFPFASEPLDHARTMLACYIGESSGNDQTDAEMCFAQMKTRLNLPIQMWYDPVRFKQWNTALSEPWPQHVVLDYRDLQQANLDKVCDLLNLDRDRALTLWNRSWPLASCDDRLWCLGRWWDRP